MGGTVGDRLSWGWSPQIKFSYSLITLEMALPLAVCSGVPGHLMWTAASMCKVKCSIINEIELPKKFFDNKPL